MMSRYLSHAGLVIALAGLLDARSAAAQESVSAPAAQKFGALMRARNLQAFAAQDPLKPNRYVAALFYPDSQLLVVAGEPLLPAVAQYQFAQRQHAALYSTLHQAVSSESKLFVQDMQADGLQARPKDSVDIVYNQVTQQMIFDGSPGKRHQSNQDYAREFSAADRDYGKLLELLLRAAEDTAAP